MKLIKTKGNEMTTKEMQTKDFKNFLQETMMSQQPDAKLTASLYTPAEISLLAFKQDLKGLKINLNKICEEIADKENKEREKPITWNAIYTRLERFIKTKFDLWPQIFHASKPSPWDFVMTMVHEFKKANENVGGN